MDSVLRNASGLGRTLFAILAIFLGLTCLRVHGYSVSLWHDVIDGTPRSEVILNDARHIRRDDWVTHLTLALAQRNHVPPFPSINQNFIDGQKTLVHPMPTAFPLALFRPQTWGYYFGTDFGLAWNWNANVLGLFASVFALLWTLTQGALTVSLTGATLLCFSPFFVYWSYNSAPVTTFACVGVLAAYRSIFSPSRMRSVLWGLLLYWCGVSFGMTMYPPYQIPLVYAAAALLAGLIHRTLREAQSFPDLRFRAGVLFFVLIAIAFTGYGLLAQAKDVIEAMNHSVYPGSRRIIAGQYPLPAIFSNNFVSLRQFGDSPLFGNICEGSSFIYLLPISIAMIISKLASGKKLSPLVFWCGGFWLAYFLWTLVGMPDILSKLLLLDRVPFNRFSIALGLVDLALIAILVSSQRNTPGKELLLRKAIVLGGALLIILCIWVLRYYQIPLRWVGLRSALLLIGTQLLVLGLVAYRPKESLLPILAASILLNAWFNPLAQGGLSYLEENLLARKITEIHAASGHGTPDLWAGFNDHFGANLLRALGIKAYNGFQLYPQLRHWKPLDPDGQAVDVYNRVAHVSFDPAPPGEKLSFRLLSSDAFAIRTSLSDPLFLRLRARHVLYRGLPGPDLLKGSPYRVIFTYGHYSILERTDL